MKRLLFGLLVLLWPAAAFAQLGTGILDICAASSGSDAVANGVTVTLSGTVTKGNYAIHGTVHLANNVQLTADTICLYSDGTLDTTSTPGTGIVVTFRNFTMDTGADPKQWGHGWIASGAATLIGTTRTPFVRLAAEPRAGNTTLTLATTPTGWTTGDRIVIPDTRAQQTGTLQYEDLTISAISGVTVTLSAALTYDHLGSKNAVGATEYLPHVANLTRSIVFRSESATGVRGHSLFTDQANINVRYVAFQDMGRTTVDSEPDDAAEAGPSVTNQVGRYALHAHHLRGPASPQGNGAQYTLIGNVIEGGSKWAIGVHDSHYGLIQANVAYNTAGAAFMTEDGSESQNIFDGNLAMRLTGRGDRGSTTGRAPVGFFFRGPNNFVRNNVVIGAPASTEAPDTGYGYKYFQQFVGPSINNAATTRIPNAPGVDTMVDGNITFTDVTAMPILQFQDNEVYGGESGLSYWWIGSYFQTPRVGVGTSTFKNLVAWNIYNKGVFAYESSNVTFDGLIVRGGVQCFYAADYTSDALTITNANVQGCAEGIDPSTQSGTRPQTISNTIIKATTGLTMTTPWSSGAKAEYIQPRTVVLNNVNFTGSDTQINMAYSTTPVRNLIVPDSITVTNHNGVSGDNFRLYYQQQAPGFQVPMTISNGATGSDAGSSILGAPVAGLTNTQTLATYGIAIAGAIAPCSTTRAGITGGFVCGSGVTPPPTPDTTPPTVTVTAPAVSAIVSGTVALSASASDAIGIVSVQFAIDGVNVGSADATAPYSVNWASTFDGSHTVTATARDAAGNAASASNVFTVRQSNPTTAPTITLTSNLPSVAVNTTYVVTATTDVQQVHNVKLDGVSILSPSDCGAVNCVKATNESQSMAGTVTHTLTSTNVSGVPWPDVTVQVVITSGAPPAPDTTAPTVSITAPAASATVSGASVAVTATAADAVGVSGVQFLLDGANLGAEDTSAAYGVTWDTTAVANGSHSLTAIARDAAGNQRTATAVSVLVNNAPPTTMTMTVNRSTITFGQTYTLTLTTAVATVFTPKLDGATVFTGGDCGVTLCQKSITFTPSIGGVITHTLSGVKSDGSAWPLVTVAVTVVGGPLNQFTVDQTVRTCQEVFTATPPDGTGGWTVVFRSNTVPVSSSDSVPPYTRTVVFNAGTYNFTAFWTKPGRASVTSGIITRVCQ